MRAVAPWALYLALFGAPGTAFAGAQVYEPLAASVQAAMSKAVSDHAPRTSAFKSKLDEVEWLTAMSRRMDLRVRDHDSRIAMLKSVHYEASRAGLDPQLVLGLIQEYPLRLHRPAPLSGSGERRSLPRARALQRQPGQA